MPIHFRCKYCDSKLSITRRKGGLQVQCPSCYKYVIVPAVADGIPTTPAKVAPETVVPEKAHLTKAKENALESMNPDMILSTPTKGALSPPPPPVYFDEFDDDNPMFDVVQLTASGQDTGPIPWKKLLQSNKTILIIVITFVIGFLAGFVINSLAKS
ncbi:MAG: hypothetical protein WCJ06_13115 [Planctomycetota bacterium]